ncbi:MAG: DUF4263 domain-containing protein [Chloroflexota bacterium]|nr:DUF4263 domain-containing protein [Chloroflexota bacterium]
MNINSNLLWQAIYQLYELLIDRNNVESSYQDYFEKNPIVFMVLGFDSSASFEKSSGNSLPYDSIRKYKPEPDFLCSKYDSGELCVFELKTPFAPKMIVRRTKGRRKKFRAKVEEYLSQSTEYVESIREHADARDIVENVLGIEQISYYKIALIYGLGEDNDLSEVSRLADQRKIHTEIICYDVLLNTLIERYYLGRRDYEPRPGMCFVYHIVISEYQLFPKAFICDIGNLEKDRLSVYLTNGYLVFEAVDSNGDTHKLSGSFETNKPMYIRFEFSNDDVGIYLSLNINNNEQDVRIGNVQLEYSPDISSFYLGSDIEGKNGACFQSLEHYLSSNTMEIIHKLGSYHYFLQKTKTPNGCVEFDGTKFLFRNESGDLIQIIDSQKPIYREKFGYK